MSGDRKLVGFCIDTGSFLISYVTGVTVSKAMVNCGSFLQLTVDSLFLFSHNYSGFSFH